MYQRNDRLGGTFRLQRYKKYCIYASFWRIICVFSHFSSSTDGVSVGNRHALRTQINALYNDIGDQNAALQDGRSPTGRCATGLLVNQLTSKLGNQMKQHNSNTAYYEYSTLRRYIKRQVVIILYRAKARCVTHHK